MKNKRITYKKEIDKYDIEVSYFFEIRFDDKKIYWYFHPALPKGMHWKKGDETGLGFDHHTDTQSFEDFLIKPKLDLLSYDFAEAKNIINIYLDNV